jgi:hypothetical protein
LELNEQRAMEEKLAGKTATVKAVPKKNPKKGKSGHNTTLFDSEDS